MKVVSPIFPGVALGELGSACYALAAEFTANGTHSPRAVERLVGTVEQAEWVLSRLKAQLKELQAHRETMRRQYDRKKDLAKVKAAKRTEAVKITKAKVRVRKAA